MVSGGGTGHGSLCQIRAIRAGLRGAASRMEQNLDVFGLHPWPTTDAGVDPEQDRSIPHVVLAFEAPRVTPECREHPRCSLTTPSAPVSGVHAWRWYVVRGGTAPGVPPVTRVKARVNAASEL